MEIKPIENTKEFVEYCKTVKRINVVIEFGIIGEDSVDAQIIYQDENGKDLFIIDKVKICSTDTLNLNVPLVPKITINDC